MKMRKMRKMLSAVLVLTLSMSMGLSVNATTVDEAQQKANELESQKQGAEAEKNSLTEQLNAIVKEVSTAQEKLQKKDEEIDQAQNKLIEAKLDENEQYASMKKRIKYMYESGDTQFIEILVKSKDISEFLNTAEYVSQISDYDRNMLVQFQDTVKSVETQEAALEQEYTEITKLQTELASKQTQVQAILDANNVKLADIESQIGENAAALDKLQQQAAAAAASAAAAAAAAAASSGSGSGSGGYEAPSSGGNVVSGNGQFTNPCPGAVVSSTFGYRDFDSSFHNGLDLAAAEGTPTYAADAGTVVMAGWAGTAGNWVVIDHGNGFLTKYMHHTAVCVSAGQTVSKGQQIGYVGNTGNSFGAHLHFQVELNGSPVDPQAYL